MIKTNAIVAFVARTDPGPPGETRRRNPAGGGGRRAARLSTFATLVVLATMLLLPIAGSAAPPAQETPAEDEVVLETPAVLDEVIAETPETLVEETEEVTEEVEEIEEIEEVEVVEETAEAEVIPDADANTALLAPEDQSGIYLNMFECPAGTRGDLNQLLQSCPVTYNVNFEIFGPELSLTSNGGIAFERLPAGYYRIRAFLPNGFGNPVAFCGVGPTYGQLPPFNPVVVYDGYYEFELAQGQAIFCDWFLVPPIPVTYNASILINKHFCPSAAEFDAYSATIYDLAANCQEPVFPVNFAVVKDGLTIASGTAAGAPNYLAFNQLPTGAVSVVETLPDGYGDPLVFCSVGDEFGNDRAPLAQATVDNDRIYWTLNDGDVVFCDWFNVPAPRGTTISVIKYVCPSYIDKDLVIFEAYASVCTATAQNVAFKLDGASTGNPGEQLTDANGQAGWYGMEADHYYLTEEVPAGFGRPAAFCSNYDPAAFEVREYVRYPVSAENRIEFDLADGENIACVWFNVAA